MKHVQHLTKSRPVKAANGILDSIKGFIQEIVGSLGGVLQKGSTS